MAHIEITLGGALIEHLPAGQTGNRFTYAMSQDTFTISSLFDQLGIRQEQRLLTILNGAVVQLEDYASISVKDGDKLSLMPPIAAG